MILPDLIKKVKPVENAKTATIRDFSGGWNVLDDDLNLSTKFSPRLYNFVPNSDQSISLRYGTRLFTDITPYLSAPSGIVNFEYFNNAGVVVAANGEIVKILADGSGVAIWNATIAAAQPGAPAPWSATTFASFAQFNGELIICNGVDKPLIIRNNFAVEYLHDEGTGSNVNVPIARYATVCNRFLVMAGDPVNPDRVHISSRNTSGTWYGDPLPNDATFVDVGAVIDNSSVIRGIATFRDKLIVAYVEGSIIGVLGLYDADGVHTPNFDDGVKQYGSVSHRCMATYGDDMLMLDLVGVPSLKRTVFTGTIRPERVSDLVDPDITSLIARLSFEALEDRTFSVYNQREGQFMFFVPNRDELTDTTETKAFVFSFRPSLKISAWSRFDGWNFTCSTRTVEGNVFFGDNNGKIWAYGSNDNQIFSDYLSDSTINNGEGVPITFDWELPWADVNQRMKTKTSKYISFDTTGSAQFTVNMYVDRYRLDANQADAPLLSMEMTAGDTPGFGGGGQPFGGGRNTADELLWAWPAKFMLMKLRITGSATSKLSFISISMLYQQGGFFR